MYSIKGPAPLSGGPVILCGHLKKLKTMKKKYFVLRGEAPGHLACLEYYDTKKKFDNRQTPKRSILLHSCFNINKRGDTKHKHVIALYTKDECFCLILDSEKELDEWLGAMLRLQSGDVPDGEQPRPTFEHIWQVTMQKKGLGARKNIHGPYRLCLTDQTLSLVKIGAQEDSDSIEISLNYIRRCGFADDIFYIEVGRSAVTGDGEFWMAVEDNNIALNMNDVITTAMKTSKTRWKLRLLENKDKDNKDKDNKDKDNKDKENKEKDNKEKDNKDKDKDNEMEPRQRSSSANEASKPISVLQRRHTGQKFACNYSPMAVAGTGAWTTGHATTNANSGGTARRRHSVASHPHSVNNSQSAHVTTAATTNAITTVTTTTITATTTTITTTTINTTITITATTTTATISHQRTLSLPLAAVIISQTQPSKRSVLRCNTGRERCDSLPSRARTNSEGQPMATVTGLNNLRGTHAIPHVPRPHSMCGRTSYSPPVASMPISPGSDVCSSDSAGSSPSMDDCGENILEEGTVSRYGHSLTPDEPVILDKKGDDYIYWSTTHPHLKYSPNFKSHSPSQSSYQSEMYSPCGSSPGRGGAYMPMSPATTIHSHSRGSSLVEESNVEGYVPMAPVGDDGYVDMDPVNSHNGHFPDDMSQNDGSSCSVTSGTPSTDLRFSEYHLDKVTSFLTPGEDLQARPTRAYSVGSRPEQANRHRKNRLDITPQDTNRVRAFSVGSRSKRPEIGRLANIITAPLPAGSDSSNSKSSSAPLLSSSWGHNSRMEDLMELDFTKSNVPTAVSSPPSSCSQSQSQPQSYSTATDTSSYVDMSPGQAPISTTTAPYVDMSGINKINRNNNNNTITANHNHSHMHISSLAFAHKPIITTLKPVEEAEGPYMKMDGTTEDWVHSADASPKQISSPIQEDIYHTNGPPGSTRTAPVDLPQPRRPPEGYVDMSFKSRPTLDQDYINMSMGANNRNNRKTRTGSRKEKSRSQPIAIQAGSKPSKTPSFLPLNGSPMSESLASTPASPPRATPTGSSATIFPFSLNSPQSPVKPFTKKSDEFSTTDVSKQNKNNDYAVLESAKTINSSISLSTSYSTPSMETLKSNTNNEKLPSSIGKNAIPAHTEFGMFGNITKKLSDLTVSKPRLVTASPNTSPTLTGFKPSTVQQPKPSSPKFIEETPSSTPTSTPTPTPSPLDSEGYEKLQPGATILHYAHLDLPEIGNPTPVSPASTQENFTYAEIDFAKLRQS
ncbi:insulin receptor substrate 1-B isoform X1 [Cataglyphis hispanica]|uniref:insulin receptor substrate 1-B isoform X1 n=1 Tax=Cataglyphis hispanica TaxID=1086592 RepID=UPI002180974B|nr:insulin receptor substrate 1-B isoform X1 [Cataglyphis hispanica]